MEEWPKVAAVVVTYNRSELLMRCLDALLEQTIPCHVLIVDNASTDSTEKRVAERKRKEENLRYHNMGSNTGGAGGFNYGMNWAVREGYQYIWLMDDDCLPKPDALERLLEADKHLGGPINYGFLSSAVLWMDGRECVMNRPKVVKSFYHYLELLRYSILQIEQATFVSMLLPAKTVLEFGLPISEYFIWGDDIEYTHRIALRGSRPCYLVGNSQVIHAMKDNLGSNIATDSTDRLWRYRYAFRNEADLYRKEGMEGAARYGVRCARSAIGVLLKAKDHRLKRLGTLLCGVLQGLLFFPKTELIDSKDQKLSDR